MKKAIKTALAITCVGSLLTCALAGCTTTKSYKATRLVCKRRIYRNAANGRS